jgi:hypothetical protein
MSNTSSAFKPASSSIEESRATVPPPSVRPAPDSKADPSRVRPTGASRAKYSFDRNARVGKERTPDLADDDVDVLLERLKVQGVAKDSEDHALIHRFCMEISVNIAWYARKLRRERSWQAFWSVAAVILGIAILALIIAPTLAFAPTARDQGSQAIIAAQVGILGADALGTLQMLSSVVDVKARVGAFWKASADLKELLFTFEARWRGRALDGGSKLTDDFKTAVVEAVQQARRIAREERDTFFGSYRSPTEVLSTVGSVLDVVRGRRQELATVQREALAARTSMQDAFDSGVRALRERVLDARAAVAGAQERVDALPPNSADRPSAETTLAQARAELKRAEERLRLQIELHAGET